MTARLLSSHGKYAVIDRAHSQSAQSAAKLVCINRDALPIGNLSLTRWISSAFLTGFLAETAAKRRKLFGKGRAFGKPPAIRLACTRDGYCTGLCSCSE